jgi:hypothetical protein
MLIAKNSHKMSRCTGWRILPKVIGGPGRIVELIRVVPIIRSAGLSVSAASVVRGREAILANKTWRELLAVALSYRCSVAAVLLTAAQYLRPSRSCCHPSHEFQAEQDERAILSAYVIPPRFDQRQKLPRYTSHAYRHFAVWPRITPNHPPLGHAHVAPGFNKTRTQACAFPSPDPTGVPRICPGSSAPAR